ncbi:MAG TPA: molybdopterin-dependent oxidoreductase [Chloroflexota bacterium]|nr:molybdopterin-dependent oxidoreductase [Chloroflexota bacterium]
MDIRQRLPVHPVPELVHNARGQELRLDGLVRVPCALSAAELASLPTVELSSPFECEEGWRVDLLRWRGVRLLDVLALAKPRAEAVWVRVSAGEFTQPVALTDAEGALLASELNGQPLSQDHGGPWRLVLPGASCFSSVKWVDHLELTAQSGEASGQAIALARLGK